MTISLKIGICYLLTEFTANTFIVLGNFKTAGAISALLLQALLDSLDDFFILVKSYVTLHIYLNIKFQPL